MMEHSGRSPEEISFCYLGDARNNVGNSLMVCGTLLGMDVRLCAPQDLWPESSLVARCRELAEASGARLLLTEDLEPAVSGADFLYTDVWVSMGEPPERWEERIRKLRPYQVNRRVMELTGNRDVAFLHCLPAFHDRNTKVGEEIYRTYGLEGMEVTDEVFESAASIVFDQAENRMHTIKAIMVATLGD